jgi:acyl carrier protein
MTNYEKYVNAFVETFDVAKEDVESLKYMGIQEWDSVGHMGLISAVEEAFDIVMETDDIIEFNSFAKGKELLAKYKVEF